MHDELNDRLENARDEIIGVLNKHNMFFHIGEGKELLLQLEDTDEDIWLELPETLNGKTVYVYS